MGTDAPSPYVSTTTVPTTTPAPMPSLEHPKESKRRFNLLENLISILALISSLCIAGVAAYFSVIGLTALFPGALIPIVLMGGTLEASKLIAALWLHQNWYKCNKFMRSYLTFAVVVLMLITSIGIFGFLSKSHLDHQKSALEETTLMEQYSKKIEFENSLVSQYKENINSLNTQIGSFNNFKKEDIETEENLLKEIYKNLDNNIKIEQDRIKSLDARLSELESERLLIESKGGLSKNSK